ncbi:MAG TPA: DUF4293 domain-containing protein [Bacteroidia bacterium]|jgi:hypothetical protein|nr:DUF4293 domain-containing protein [Bacteroidia bacterium]
MIQRVQSIFLLVVIAVSAGLILLPFVSYENLFNTFTLTAFNKIYSSTWHYVAGSLNLLILVLSCICLFLFKKRMLQFKLANLLALLNVFLLAILLFANLIVVEEFLSGKKHTLWPSYLPVVSMICAYLAGIFIKKDENLVRSADRIR